MTGIVENKMAAWSAPRKNIGRVYFCLLQKNIHVTSGACVCNKATEYAVMNGFMEYIQHLVSSISISRQLYDIHEKHCVIFMWGFRSIHYKLHDNSALGNSYDTLPMTCNCKMSLSVNGWQDKYRYDVANDLLSCSAKLFVMNT